MLGLSDPAVAACLSVVFIGATIQGISGFGLGLLSSPFLVAVDPAFIPGAMLIAMFPLQVGIAVADHDHIDWSGFRAAVIGRVPGSAVGAFAITVMSHRALAITVAAVVYLGVILSISGIRFATSQRSIATAGFASGLSGTAVAMGGPPMALVYQRHDPHVVRSTMAIFFAVGTTLSFVALAIGGSFGSRELQLGLLLTPAVFAGLAASRYVNRLIDGARLDGARLRPIILALSATAATTLLITEFA